MTDDQHGEGTPQGGGRWDPLPQGDYDDGATAFVQLPEGGIDALLSGDSPLAAPGHGYVPPRIAVAPGTGDPSPAGTWSAPAGGDGWPDANAARQAPPADDRFTYQPGATQHWTFEEPAAPAAPGHDVTGQWSIPVAGGDLPDESGEFTTSSLVEQWGGTPPATLPGGAPAPWATDGAGNAWGRPAADPESAPAPDHTGTHPSGDTPVPDAYAREMPYGHAPTAYPEPGHPAPPHTETTHGPSAPTPPDHGAPGHGAPGHPEFGPGGVDHAEFAHGEADHADAGHAEFGHAGPGRAEGGHAEFAQGEADHADAGHPEFGHGEFGHAGPGRAEEGHAEFAQGEADHADARHAEFGHAGPGRAEEGHAEFAQGEADHADAGHAEFGHAGPGRAEGGHAEFAQGEADDADAGHAEFGHAGPSRGEPGHPESRHPQAGHADSGHADADHRGEPANAPAPADAHAPARAPESPSDGPAGHEGPAGRGAAPQAATTAETAGQGTPADPAATAAHPDTADAADAAPPAEAGAPAHGTDAGAAGEAAQDRSAESGEAGPGEAPEASADGAGEHPEHPERHPAPAAEATPDTATATAHAVDGESAEEPAPSRQPHDDHPLASYVLRVNGADRPVTDAWIGESLLYVLRERLGLAGAKDGCSQGECGACNVQVDGRLVASCLVPAVTAAGSEVRTVEGLAVDGQPSDVQRALARCGAVQCGFCVPGMAMTVHDLLEGNPAPTELETRQALCGNLCRCSGYRGVLQAVQEVVAEREASHGADAETDPDGARIPHQAGPGSGGVNPSAFEAPGAFDTPGPYGTPDAYGAVDPYGTPPHGTPGPYGPHDQSYGQDGGQA